MDVRPKDSGRRPSKQNRHIAKTVKSENLLDLPVELLLKILSFLDIKTLGRLGQVCRELNALSRDDVSWSRLLDRGDEVRLWCPRPKRLFEPAVPVFQIARVSKNWWTGIGKEFRLIPFRRKEMPRLKIRDSRHQSLFSSYGRTIEKRRKRNNGRFDGDVELFKGMQDDVADFVVGGGDNVVAVGRDGSVATWQSEADDSGLTGTEKYTIEVNGKWKTRNVLTRYCDFELKNAHGSDIHAVTEHEGVLITGSRDTFVKMWKIGGTEERISRISEIPVKDRVWSLACSPDGAVFASGTAGLSGVPALRLWSVETATINCVLSDAEMSRNGAGILHLHFESPSQLVSAGYDTCLRVWDLRTGSRVLCLEDPHDNAIYCASSDDTSPMIIAGTARHACVNLWDRRNSKEPVRSFFANQAKAKGSSPVYSMAVDWDKLLVAYDFGITCFDFGVKWGDKGRTQHLGAYSYGARDRFMGFDTDLVLEPE